MQIYVKEIQIYAALLNDRNTPQQGHSHSPAQRLMNHCTCTQLPTANTLLKSEIVDSNLHRQNEKRNGLQSDDNRSYTIRTPYSIVRRNRCQLRPTAAPEQPQQSVFIPTVSVAVNTPNLSMDTVDKQNEQTMSAAQPSYMLLSLQDVCLLTKVRQIIMKPPYQKLITPHQEPS